MGTQYRVVVVDHDRRFDKAEVTLAIDTALAQVNRHLSNWDSGSEISRFNLAAGDASAQMSPDLARVMAASEAVHLASDGRFDTTIGPLIELWGFGAPGAQLKPDDRAVEQALSQSGHAQNLTITGGQLQKRAPQAQVYLAGIGKGYGADRVGQALRALGATDYMVEIGGDLFTAGRNPDGLPWQIGIEQPSVAARGVFDVVGVSGRGLATSGDYRNYFEADGQRYSHLIDPTTGRPVAHKTASATVIAEDAMLADAWSTAMLILGRARGLDVAARHGIAVQFIDRDPQKADQLAFTSHTSAAFDALTA